MKKHIQLDKTKFKLKIVLIILITCLFGYLFIDKLYLLNDRINAFRIIIPFILFVLFSLSLFFKPQIKLSNKKSFIIWVTTSIIFILFNLYMIQYAQGFSILSMSIKFIIINIGILGIIFLIAFSLFNSFRLSIITLNTITCIFAIIEYYVMEFRGIGFLAVDIQNIKTAMNVANTYSYSLNYETYITIFIMISLIPIIISLKETKFFIGKKRLIPIIITTIMFIGLIFSLNNSFINQKLKIEYFMPQKTFKHKGLPISFVKSIKDLIIKEPKGYSISNINSIMKNYNSDKKEKVKGPNLIIIMNESYTDFEETTDLKINKDYLPFIHSLKDNTIKGSLYTSVFGGGTSVTEFEAITSNSMAFLPYGTNAYSAYIHSDFPNITTTLRDLDYTGLIAIHPYKPSGYNRDKVYPLLGFNKFISMDDFGLSAERYSRHISDVADFDWIIKEYENSKKETNKPFYVFNVTMQNHGPYICQDVKQTIKLEYKEDYPKANCYVNMLNYTDKAVKKLIKYFENQNENTIIAMFGDHEPKLENEFYDEIMKTYNKGKEYKKLEKNNPHFFIWANYDIKEKNDVRISSNYMSNLILETAKLPKTGYDKYINSIRKEIPVITQAGYIAKDGKFYTIDDKKSPYYKIINNYNIVEYNNLFDTKNRINQYFYLK